MPNRTRLITLAVVGVASDGGRDDAAEPEPANARRSSDDKGPGRTAERAGWNHHRGSGRKHGGGGHAERAAGRAAVFAPDRGARRPRRPHRVQSRAPSTPDRALLGIHPPERTRLLPQSRRRLLAPRLRDRAPAVGRRGALADGLRPHRRERRGDPHRDPALVDARAERPLPPRPDLARRSAPRRHHRQVRLRRPVPPHAVAAGHRRRGRQRRPPAQRARRRPARHVGRRGHAGRRPRRSARTSRSSTIPTTAAIRSPGASTISSASAPRARAPPTGPSPPTRPKSSATASSSTPARWTTSR